MHRSPVEERNCWRKRQSRESGWYDATLFATTLTIYLLCCLDALFTLSLLGTGAKEVNAVMALLIENGARTFVSIKLGITGICLIILVLYSSFRLFGFLRVRYVLYGILGTYGLLFFYQIDMLSRVH